jgi:CheY-like chemotaxis protein
VSDGSDPALLSRRLEGLFVLAVDDDDHSRTILSALLSMYGAHATVVGSAQEALRALNRTSPDILVSDISMPEEDGLLLIQKVRALGPEQSASIPAIALTGLRGPEHRARALAADFQEHLTKPLDIEHLVSGIERLTGRG